ncbi:hypothetical protein CN216_12970, partial [Sinorhizobium meliloti]
MIADQRRHAADQSATATFARLMGCAALEGGRRSGGSDRRLESAASESGTLSATEETMTEKNGNERNESNAGPGVGRRL